MVNIWKQSGRENKLALENGGKWEADN